MAIAYVDGSTASSGASSASTLALPAINAATGNLIVVFGQGASQDVTSVADTAGNTYVQAGSTESGQACFYAMNVIANAANVVTLTFAASTDYRAGGVVQYSGLATTSAYDAAGAFTTTAATTTHTTNTATTAQADEVVVGWFIAWSTPYTLSAGTSTNLRVQQAGGNCAIADRIESSAGSYAVQLTSSSATEYGHIVRTFKMAGSGSTYTPRSMLLGVG